LIKQTQIKLDNGSLTLRYTDEKQLFKDLLEISNHTYETFACKFDLTEDAVNSWLRKDRTIPRYVMVYLLDILELNLRLIGYMLDTKKSDFLVLEIRQLQKQMEDLRLENESIPEPSLYLNTSKLITDEKPLNTSIISNLTLVIKSFLPNEFKDKCNQ
jgi:hypothetical protein